MGSWVGKEPSYSTYRVLPSLFRDKGLVILCPFQQYYSHTRIMKGCVQWAGPRSAIGRAPDSSVRGPGFDTRSGNILSFLLPLFQEGQLSVTGESMCTKYWLTA